MSHSQVLLLLLPIVFLGEGSAAPPVDDSTAPRDEDSTAQPAEDSTVPPDELTTVPVDECPAPTVTNGTFAWIPNSGRAAAWTLTCNLGYRPDPRIGSLFFCSNFQDIELLTPECEVDPGCMGADAIPTGSSAIGTTCGPVIGEGVTCVAVCDGTAAAVGAFLCSSGQIVHMSHCVDAGDVVTNVTNETVEKVAATIAMELDQQPTDESVKGGIAAALDLPKENVHGLRWIVSRRLTPRFLGSEGRGLETNYTVSYELIVPTNSNANAIVLMASRLAVEGTSENQALKAVLRDDGIAVGAVHQVVAPRSFNQVVVRTANGVVAMPTTNPNVSPTSDEEENSNLVGPVIGGIVGGFLGLFLVGLCCYCASNVRRRKIEA